MAGASSCRGSWPTSDRDVRSADASSRANVVTLSAGMTLRLLSPAVSVVGRRDAGKSSVGPWKSVMRLWSSCDERDGMMLLPLDSLFPQPICCSRTQLRKEPLNKRE